MCMILWISVELNWELSRTTRLRNHSSVMMQNTVNKTNKKGNDPRMDGLTVKVKKSWILGGNVSSCLTK